MEYLKLFENHSQYADFIETEDFIRPNVSHCIEQNEVHYNPILFIDGHEYVDLGLPSGTLWATMNVGAKSKTDYGLYFAWGETQGRTDVSTETFRCSDYEFNPSGDHSTMTKYNATDGKTVLDLEDDAVHVNWGGNWHMPTKEQCEELFNTTYVTNAWITNYRNSGVNGRLFTSVNNGNTMFIPAAGGYVDSSVYGVGNYNVVWTSTLHPEYMYYAWYLYCHNDDRTGVGSGYSRCSGLSVRGVITPSAVGELIVTPPIEEVEDTTER